jgi:hypothetical protein
MRRRLWKFLPIFLIALAVQIFAPIGACWAASIAGSDPLHGAAICHDDAASASGQADQTGQPRARDGCCSICKVVHTGAPIGTPVATSTMPYRHAERMVWLDRAPNLFGSRTGSQTQARAPPLLT